MGNQITFALDTKDHRKICVLHKEFDNGGTPGHCRFFAVGGQANRGVTPQLGVLYTPETKRELGYGHPFIFPTPQTCFRWGMWFDLGDVDLHGQCALLEVYGAGGVLLGSVCLTFETCELSPSTEAQFTPDIGTRIRVVQVVYPAGGTFCANGVTSYGSFGPNDTKMLTVRAKKEMSTEEVVNGSPYYNNQGFWTASFTLEANQSYRIVAEGDNNASAPSSVFSTQAC